MRLRRAFPWLVSLLSLHAMAMAAQTATSGSDSFMLEPGDVVQVSVWREKDLDCSCVVDEHGRLTLPMLGVVPVLSRPWDDLRDSLLADYGRQLRNPSVTLTPLRRVEVLGEVARPGQYLADPTLSLAGVVALAGGANGSGDLHRIRVVRDGKTIVRAASVEDMLLRSGIKSNDQIFVDRRPWIERNGSFVASALISTAALLVTILHP
jgi:polysaccharide export outer membrane protein